MIKTSDTVVFFHNLYGNTTNRLAKVISKDRKKGLLYYSICTEDGKEYNNLREIAYEGEPSYIKKMNLKPVN